MAVQQMMIDLKVTGADGRAIEAESGKFPALTFVKAMLDMGADVADIDGYAEQLAAGETVRLEGGACPLFEYRLAG